MSARAADRQALAPRSTGLLRTLVVDDDPVSRRLIQRYVEQHDRLALAGSCASATEAVPRLRDGDIDVIFLDVEMPEMTGLDLARAFVRERDKGPQVVLVTGKAEYAVEAFDVAVADYLLKPVQYARFLQAVERIVARHARRGDPVADGTTPVPAPVPAADDAAHEASLATSRSRDVMFVRVDGRLVRVALREVHWVEAKGDYVVLHSQRKRYTVHATMRMMEERLPAADFARVHRSHIVRLDRIVDIEEATLVVEREVIPVGASYRTALLARLNTL